MEVFNIAILLNNLSLADITPFNLLNDDNISAIIQALDPELQSLTEDIKHSLILSRISELDENVLNFLAWQFHADLYDLTIPDSYATQRLKQEAVQNSLTLHMKKGTVWAIKEALRQIDIQADFIPWWQDGGEPYTFKLDAIVAGDFYKTSGRDILVKSILRAVNSAKSARSYLAGIHIQIDDTQHMPVTFGLSPVIDWLKSIPLHHDDFNGNILRYWGITQIEDYNNKLNLARPQFVDTPNSFGVIPFIDWGKFIPNNHDNFFGEARRYLGITQIEDYNNRLNLDRPQSMNTPDNFGVIPFVDWEKSIPNDHEGFNGTASRYMGITQVEGYSIRMNLDRTAQSNLTRTFAAVLFIDYEITIFPEAV